MKNVLHLATLAVLLTGQLAFGQYPVRSFSSLQAIKNVGSRTFLSANDGFSGKELWITDGTSEGTRQVKDINPGYYDATPELFTEFKGKLFFRAYHPQFGSELWVSDGTEVGTQMVADLTPNTSSSIGSYPMNLTVYKDYLYFTTQDGSLYKTDGTAAGTVKTDATKNYGQISNLTIVSGDLYYYVDDKLKKTNGTSSSTILLPDNQAGIYFSSLYSAGGKLFALWGSSYFTKIRIQVLGELDTWNTVFDLAATGYTSMELGEFKATNTQLYFSIHTDAENADTDNLYVSDGTAAGTKLVKSFAWSRHSYRSAIENFTEFNNEIYFRAGDPNGRALWKTNGTTEGTKEFFNVQLSSTQEAPIRPLTLNNRLYFAGSVGLGGASPTIWWTDATAAGTKTYFNASLLFDSAPNLLTAVGNEVYFATFKQFSATLWSTRPSPAIYVSSGFGRILTGGTMSFESYEAASCLDREVTIANYGLKDLNMYGVSVSGRDFFLNGSLASVIKPNQSVKFKLVFMPQTNDVKAGGLEIKSSDEDESVFTANLVGKLQANARLGFCNLVGSVPKKQLSTTLAEQPITLSKNSVEEFSPIGTEVGLLSLSGATSPTFTLATGEGDADNQRFSIDGNRLLTATQLNFATRPRYSIRVKATTASGSNEAVLHISLTQKVLHIPLQCENKFERIDYGYTGIATNSVGHVFAITDEGILLKSLDEGLSWQRVASGTPYEQLVSIFFKGTTGFIVGERVLLKSEDDGASWFQVYLPIGNSFSTYVQLYFIDSNVGYLGGSGSTTYFTSNGGKTWEVRQAAAAFDNLRKFFFLSETTGYALRGTSELVRTLDGGRTWNNLPLTGLGFSPGLIKVHFVNEKNGFLITTNGFFRTTDSGEKWEKIFSSGGTYRSDLVFYDNLNGFLFMGDYGSVLYKTTDGGTTWTNLQSPSPGAVVGIAKCTSGKLISAQHTTFSSNWSRAGGRSLNTSIDGGATWKIASELSDVDFYEIDFPTKNTGFVFGDYQGLKTTDGGLTWKALPFATKIGSAHFIDENVGILSDGFHVYRTTDGGQTIVPVLVGDQNPEHYVSFERIYGFNSNLIFVYSSHNYFKSIDGGKNWVELVPGESDFYTTGFQFITASTGYRMDLFGTIEKTTDGGETWTSLYVRDPNASNVFRALNFVDENVGYKGGDQLMKTTDGGHTWTLIYTQFSDIKNLHFADELNGTIVTNSGTIYATKNGGQTWTSPFIYDANNVFSVKIRNGNLYLCGDYGYMGQIANTPAAPTQPGYIYGPTSVCTDNTEVYKLPTPYDGSYTWNVSGVSSEVKLMTNAVQIGFLDKGEVTITVTAANQCGESQPRTLTIVASEPTPPIISGAETVDENRKAETYEVTNGTEQASLWWSVEGGTIASTGNKTVKVDWDNEGDGAVKLQISDPVSGCLAQSQLTVSIVKPVGLEETNAIRVFPNPSRDIFNVTGTNCISGYEILSVEGKVVRRKLIDQAEATLSIDMTGEKPGMYLLKLFGCNTSSVTKVVKY